MAHDVFISHSSKDKPTADAVCALLESDGLRCWIAPRDVQAGVSYAGAIIDAINECRAMVLIFSDAANASPQIEREIERAANRRIPLLPFRIENVTPQHGLEYFLSTPHWLDAFTPPLETHIRELARQLHALLDPKPTAGAAAVAPLAGQAAAAPAAKPAVAARPAAARSRMTTGAMVAIGAVVVGGALAVAGGTAVWLGGQHGKPAPASSSSPPSSAVASSAITSSATSGAPASSESAVAGSSAAADSAAAEAVVSLPPPGRLAERGTRAPIAVRQGPRVAAIRPPPPMVVRRPPPFRPPLHRPPHRPPPFRRHPHPFV